jgi:putative endonuclease
MTHKKQVGQYGEELACEFLEKRGYVIVKRNLQRSYKEIDILARINNTYVFIEVRTRTTASLGGAVEAIGSRKLKNLKFAVRSYVMRKNLDFNFVRVDFLAVDINKQKKSVKFQHFKDIA